MNYIRAVLPDANVPASIRSTGVPVVHGSASDLGSILDTWLAAHADGIACVIGDPAFRATSRVRALTPELSKGLEFDLVVFTDPRQGGAGPRAVRARPRRDGVDDGSGLGSRALVIAVGCWQLAGSARSARTWPIHLLRRCRQDRSAASAGRQAAAQSDPAHCCCHRCCQSPAGRQRRSAGDVRWVGVRGLEPRTSSLSGRRSNRLSYTPLAAREAHAAPRNAAGIGYRIRGVTASVGLPERDLDTAAHAGDQVVDHRADRGQGRDQDDVHRAQQHGVPEDA